MSFILSIDTSTEHASVCVCEKENCLSELINSTQKDHAAWLHVAIRDALENAGIRIQALNAIGITAGPGSYTGLRVGMSAAKGLCYALGIPLIAVNTLEAMAAAALNEESDYFCPMIDARRMEVFTALYDQNLTPVMAPCALMLNENSFHEHLKTKNILFFGSGKNKLQQILDEKKARFKDLIFNSSDLYPLIYDKYLKHEFNNLTHVQPVYLKEYYTLFSTKS